MSGRPPRRGNGAKQPRVGPDAETPPGPAGGAFYAGDDLPGLRNRLLFGGLGGQRVVRSR